MQVAAERIVDRAQVTIAGELRAQLLAAPPLHRIVIVFGHVRLPALQRLFLAWLERHTGMAVAPVAGDVVAPDAIPHQRHALAREIEQPARVGAPDQPLQRVLLAAVTDDRLAAVAPRGAPADPFGLQHHHPVARLGQFQRRRQSGVARAEDADVGVHLAFQPRLRRQRRGAGGVPGGRIRGGVAPAHTDRRYHSYSRSVTWVWKARISLSFCWP